MTSWRLPRTLTPTMSWLQDKRMCCHESMKKKGLPETTWLQKRSWARGSAFLAKLTLQMKFPTSRISNETCLSNMAHVIIKESELAICQACLCSWFIQYVFKCKRRKHAAISATTRFACATADASMLPAAWLWTVGMQVQHVIPQTNQQGFSANTSQILKQQLHSKPVSWVHTC